MDFPGAPPAQAPATAPAPPPASSTFAGQGRRDRPLPPPSRRRDKPQLSCNLCRQRKVKCDRQLPCSTCADRGLAGSCVYAPDDDPHARKPSTAAAPGSARSGAQNRDAVRGRIHRLESLVMSLMQQVESKESPPQASPGASTTTDAQSSSDVSRPSPAGSGSSFAAAAAAPAGAGAAAAASAPQKACSRKAESEKIKKNPNSVRYISGFHWMTVLDSISDIKDELDREGGGGGDGEGSDGEDHDDGEHGSVVSPAREPQPLPEAAPQPEMRKPFLIYGFNRNVTKAEILSTIPDRPTVDRLVSMFFKSVDMAFAVLHTTQFMRQYEKFWQDPMETPIVWIGLLYSIMCLAAQYQLSLVTGSGGNDAQAEQQQLLRAEQWAFIDGTLERCCQCLSLGNYTMAGPHVLETVLLYAGAEHLACKESNEAVHLLSGIMCQIALRMGLHRDPSNFAGMSAFEGEMRRRQWTTVRKIDSGYSAQMGLPRLLGAHLEADTAEPRNLHDTDFDEDTAELPPSRPESEKTPMLFIIAKSRFMAVTERVHDTAMSPTPRPYEEIMAVHRQLQLARDAIPASLRWHSLQQCLTEPAHIIMQRMFGDLVFLNVQLLLHWKYSSPGPGRAEDQYRFSRRTCVDASMRLLEFQHMMEDEMSHPGGLLFQVKWRISNSVSCYFFYATSILCICLRRRAARDDDGIGPDTLAAARGLLRRSLAIWQRADYHSREARKAEAAVRAILRDTDGEGGNGGGGGGGGPRFDGGGGNGDGGGDGGAGYDRWGREAMQGTEGPVEGTGAGVMGDAPAGESTSDFNYDSIFPDDPFSLVNQLPNSQFEMPSFSLLGF